MAYPCTQVWKPHSCGADAPKPAGPCRCGAHAPKPAGPCSYGATQTLNGIPLYAVPEAAQLLGRRTIALDCSILKIGVVSCCICFDDSILFLDLAPCQAWSNNDGSECNVIFRDYLPFVSPVSGRRPSCFLISLHAERGPTMMAPNVTSFSGILFLLFRLCLGADLDAEAKCPVVASLVSTVGFAHGPPLVSKVGFAHALPLGFESGVRPWTPVGFQRMFRPWTPVGFESVFRQWTPVGF